MLSSLPKLADRTFVLGELLPSLLFAIALLFLFQDQPTAAAWIDAVTEKSIGWQGVYFLLAVWVIAVVLLVLNHPLYRFLEGYKLPRRLAECLKKRHRRRLRAVLAELKELYAKWAEQGTAFPTADEDRIQLLSLERMKWLPSRERDVLPTRFGNAIRAFEFYPHDIYGADGIAIWLRLGTVIPKAFAEQIQGVRSQIDFLVNCCMFSVIIALLGFCRTLISANWHDLSLCAPSGFPHFISSIETTWLIWTLGGVISSGLFYHWAVTRIPACGNLVMTAFDCYLPALATQLGFELPATEAERQDFWNTLSQQVNYGRDPDGKVAFQIEKWKRIEQSNARQAED